MGLSQLAEMCQKCPKVETCNHKRMEALAFLPDPCEMEQATGGIVPVGVVNLCDGSTVVMDKTETVGGFNIMTPQQTKDFAEAVIKEMERALCVPAGLLSGRYGRGYK